MRDQPRPSTILFSLLNAGGTVSAAAVVVAALLALAPATSGSAALRATTHPATCRSCAASDARARAAL